MNIHVTKTFLPPRLEFDELLERIWGSCKLTNQGDILLELESKLKNYLNVEYFHFLSNGTIALQLAIKAMDLEGSDIITTPFSYVATTSSILWEGCNPVFVDIESDNFCIDPSKIENKITKKTKAILAVHVFGYACNINAIDLIAKKHGLKVIYDGAHAFGVEYKNKSIFEYGDASTCSFHATKLFHTVEGGAFITKNKLLNDKLELMKRFGHDRDNHLQLGINAKNSELHAAMGLINLRYIDDIILKRKNISGIYDEIISKIIIRPKNQGEIKYNYSYYPVIFESESQLLRVLSALEKCGIFPRRYFYPSLNLLPYLKKSYSCPISESISSRVLCLPLYYDLSNDDASRIANIILRNC
jgi:dTDP-4-amino-4,6-dideoxygalactose transaminase